MENEKTAFRDEKFIEKLHWRKCRFFDVANMDPDDDCHVMNQSIFYLINIVFTINNIVFQTQNLYFFPKFEWQM